MRSFWLALILFLSCVGVAQASEMLAFCLEKADVRPWRTQEGGGLNIELLDRVAERLGLRFEYLAMPWKRCLVELKENRVSGAIGASFLEERLAFGVYPGGLKPDGSKRLNSDRYVVLKRKGNPVDWDGKAFSKLEGAVGIQLGYSVGDSLRALGLAVDEGAQKPEELAQKLAVGRVGAVAMLEGEARSLLEQNPGLAKQLEILPRALSEKPYFVMLSSHLAGKQPDLAQRIWSGVETVRNSREYRERERKALAELGR